VKIITQKKLKQTELNKIKGYVAECMVEEFSYDFEEALSAVEKSPFPELLKENPDYVLHYNFEYWAEYVTSMLKS